MIIFEAGFEDESLDEFDTTVNAADLNVIAGAGMGGSDFGLEIVLDGALDPTYVSANILVTTDEIGFRFFLDPNGYSPGGSYQVVAKIGCDGSHSGKEHILYVRLFDSGGLSVDIVAAEDSQSDQASVNISISDAPNYLEVYMKKETSYGAGDGYATITDGSTTETVNGLSNTDLWATISHIILGSDTIVSGLTGSYYVDELVVRDDDTVIGSTIYHTGNVTLTFDRNMPVLLFDRED